MYLIFCCCCSLPDLVGRSWAAIGVSWRRLSHCQCWSYRSADQRSATPWSWLDLPWCCWGRTLQNMGCYDWRTAAAIRPHNPEISNEQSNSNTTCIKYCLVQKFNLAGNARQVIHQVKNQKCRDSYVSPQSMWFCLTKETKATERRWAQASLNWLVENSQVRPLQPTTLIRLYI